MRTAAITLCMALAVTTVAFGQPPIPQPRNQGRVKIWTGTGLLVAGLFAVPVTSGRPKGYGPPVASFTLVAGGGALIWWGVRDRRKTTQPSTTFGFELGRSRAFH